MPDTNTPPVDDLNALLSNLQHKLTETNSLRDPILSKMYNTIENMTIDFENDKGVILEQKLNLIEKFDKLLHSKEDAEVTSVKMAMNKKNSDSLTNLAELSVNMLRQIAPGSVLKAAAFVANEPTEEELEAKVNEDPSLHPINDDEMQISELPNTEIKK